MRRAERVEYQNPFAVVATFPILTWHASGTAQCSQSPNNQTLPRLHASARAVLAVYTTLPVVLVWRLSLTLEMSDFSIRTITQGAG